jgi:glycosyltransferase involved in cell wall biosynthesis
MDKMLLNGLLYEAKGAGISNYTKHLIEAFAKEGCPVETLVRQEHLEKYKKNARVQVVEDKIKGSKDRIVYEQIKGIKKYNQYELVHFPDYAACLLTKSKVIITIHDMAIFTIPKAYTKTQRIVKKTLMYFSLKKAKGILCDSYYAKKELLHYFPKLDESKIEVVHLGIELPKRVSKESVANTLKQYEIEKPYLLTVGTIAPSKNVKRLILAFEKIKEAGWKGMLVIAGKKGWMYEEVEAAYSHSKYKEDILITGYIEDKDLEALYKQATLYISASLYEGFGLTPLEAMIRDVPTVVSCLDIFKETCRDGVLYFDPLNVEEMAKAIQKILQDKELRQIVKEKGFLVAKGFKWEETAKKTYAFYQKVLRKEERGN